MEEAAHLKEKCLLSFRDYVFSKIIYLGLDHTCNMLRQSLYSLKGEREVSARDPFLGKRQPHGVKRHT